MQKEEIKSATDSATTKSTSSLMEKEGDNLQTNSGAPMKPHIGKPTEDIQLTYVTPGTFTEMGPLIWYCQGSVGVCCIEIHCNKVM